MTPRERQIEREAAARQLALGRRAKAIQEGHLGGVLKRWINADVTPIADLMRAVAKAYLAGNMALVAYLLDTPSTELAQRERPLTALMEWLLRGRSPGRATLQETTHADDLTLAFLGTVVVRVCQDACTLSAALALAADSLRDTVQGQFISGIQGASAMQAIRERNPERWRQRKSLNRICARLHAQVKPQLQMGAGGDGVLPVRGKKVVTVLDYTGLERRLELVPPDPIAWEVMSLCWRDERDGGTHPHRSLWLGFAAMFLAASQRSSGWFEVGGQRTRHRKGHTRTTTYLMLSEEADARIKKDIERWTTAGFAPQPMIVEPEAGDYLSVKHRPVTGQRPPLGLLTDPTASSSWTEGARALSSTPWTVNTHTLGLLDEHPYLWDPTDINQVMRIAEHRRVASEEAFYLPTCMDFRGRVYYRTPWVTPQSGDLGKALLCFPRVNQPRLVLESDEDAARALEMHLASLYGGWLGKSRLPVRSDWLRTFLSGPPGTEDLSKASKPLTLGAALALLRAGEWDRIPVQLDGTCNGLQHLSALLRDEVGAKHVNLCESSLSWNPEDIYASVAERVLDQIGFLLLENLGQPEIAWARRLIDAGLAINRDLLKHPVMVLPYGGTIDAVNQALTAGVLKQLHSLGKDTPWHRYEADNYDAFKDRDLADHPLFKTDCRHLAKVVWDCILPAIPRAMAFMKALQEIGSWLGSRAIAWQTPCPAAPCADAASTTSQAVPLWVIQAKSKAQRKQVTMRGFHLPDMVRRLTLMANSNEVDPRASRTGIVANFIHSLDAAHLAASIAAFRAAGGGCVGSVHDCLLVRPSEASLMGRCLRETFVAIYQQGASPDSTECGPLSLPVRTTLDGETWAEYPSWYALAEAAGVEFPERGSFDIEEVRKSAWFFS